MTGKRLKPSNYDKNGDIIPSGWFERPQGKWLMVKENDIFMNCYKCSNCNYFMRDNYYHYCPNCGADMRGGEKT